MLSRLHMLTRHKIIPGLTTGTIYRINVEDIVESSQDIPELRIRKEAVQEASSSIGPSRSKTALVHLYANALNGWIPQENDVLRVVDVATGGYVWLRIDSVECDLMRTRYPCNCTNTMPRE